MNFVLLPAFLLALLVSHKVVPSMIIYIMVKIIYIMAETVFLRNFVTLGADFESQN